MALALQACQQTPQKLFSEPFANIISDQGQEKSEKLPPEFPIGSKKKLTYDILSLPFQLFDGFLEREDLAKSSTMIVLPHVFQPCM